MRKWQLVLLIAFMTLSCVSCRPAGDPVHYEIVNAGQFGPSRERFEAVASEEELTALRASLPDVAALAGDMSPAGHILVFLLDGTRRTAGFNIRVDAAYVQGNNVTIVVNRLRPGRDDVVAYVETSPFEVTAISRDHLPPGPLTIRFVDTRGRSLGVVRLGR